MNGVNGFIHRGDLIRLQFRFDKYSQGMFVERRNAVRHDQHLHYRADDGVLRSNADTVFDAGIRRCDTLDFDGIDLVAAHIDHIPGTACEVNQTFFIEITEI